MTTSVEAARHCERAKGRPTRVLGSQVALESAGVPGHGRWCARLATLSERLVEAGH